tara:strand:+ start:373 stop:489 length:117 start_codon:yes stop_codon:yes gene_type:complete
MLPMTELRVSVGSGSVVDRVSSDASTLEFFCGRVVISN